MTDTPTPRTIADIPLVAALCAAAATYPLMLIDTLIVGGLAVPGIDQATALVTYAAIMLTFMGAVHWGLALTLPHVRDEPWYGSPRDWRAYTASMAPGLAAWVALLLPLRRGTWLLAASFLLLLAYDARCKRLGEMPAHLFKMRAMMAIVAVAALAIGVLLR